MKKIFLSLMMLALIAGSAFAQSPVVDPGWTAFTIRESSVGSVPPVIQDPGPTHPGAIEFAITLGGQKAGLATDQLNGAKVSEIARLHIDRLDDVLNSGSLWGPYFNIWVTDGSGQYAVIANEPSNPEWTSTTRWDITDWDMLKTKTCKVYETPGWNTNSSWIHTLTGLTSFTFEDLANLVISPPPASYIADPLNGVGSGAPDELGTNIAHGYTWVFGDTAANYVTGGDGFIVDNYFATTTFNVQNTVQLTSYATIEAALADANPNDIITIANGTYNPPNTLNIAMPLTITGTSEAGVIINIPEAGSYGITPAASDITLSNFTLVANTTNQNYPIHASGTTNLPNGYDDLTITNVTVSGEHRRAGVDVHGFNNLVLSHVTSQDATGGNGFQLTGVVGATVDNLTTSNNAWGSLAVYCSQYMSRACSNITIDGATLNLGEDSLFIQDEFGLVSTNISVTGWDYQVRNSRFREAGGYSDSEGYTFPRVDLAAATTLALGFTGYEQYSSIMEVATGDFVVVEPMSIKAAINDASSGATINVAAGNYTESGQLLIDKDLSIIGDPADRPVVMTDTNTGGSGDARGWFLQTPGTTMLLQNLVLDGSGYDIYQGIRSTGDGVVDNCVMRNIDYPGYAGTAIAAFSASYFDVTNTTFENIGRVGVLNWSGGTFSGNTYTGKGPGDWLDYAVDTNNGATMVIENNTITACQGVASSDGSISAALLVSTYFGAGTTASINNNILTGNTDGVAIGYDEFDASVVSGSGNDLSLNDGHGVSNTSLVNSADFLGNWWGSATGPYNATSNPLGTGVPVGDNVLFDPWSGMSAVAAAPATTGPLSCGETTTLTFSVTTDEFTPDIFGFNAVVRASSEVNWGTISSLAPFGTTTQFYTIDNADGSFAISGTTLGNPQQPISGAGTTALFTIEFETAGEGTANITFDDMILRDPANAPIPAVGTGATITIDCTAPAAVTGITAAPGHNKVDVSWSHPAPGDVDHYEVYRGLWYDTAVGTSAYPEYDDVGAIAPTRPSGYGVFPGPAGEWLSVDDGSPIVTLAYTDDDVAFGAGRGVYYYEVFAVDAAGNGSAPAAANDRSTNYWLGDVATSYGDIIPNGQVNVPDIDALGDAFGTTDGDASGNYRNYIDVGPTYDWSRLGIPTTDNAINFEDLMIFSLNFGVVSAAKEKPATSTAADLAWVTYNDGSQALRLVNGSGLKGLRVTANVPVGAVEAGQLLDDQSELTFLKNVGENLDVSVAVMGLNNGFTGSGDLFIVRSGSGINVADLHITARNIDNSELKFTMDEASDTMTPRVFALNANYPNPFNPMTKISFSLPAAQDVTLAVYSLDGRKVATLINETRGPGLHEVVWTGRDDQGQTVSSGMYFYRLDAGPHSQVRKMTLMK